MFTDRFPENQKSSKALKVLLIMSGVLLVAAGFGLLVQFLWNATIARMFELTAISYWQAVGLFILAKLFFGFGSRNAGFGRCRSKRHKPVFNGDLAKGAARGQHAQFKAYWNEEGEKAFEEYLSTHNQEPKNESQE